MIAEHLSVEEVAGIKEGFRLMDTGNKGKIDINELRVGLHKLGHQIPDSDLAVLMEAVSAFVLLQILIFRVLFLLRKVTKFLFHSPSNRLLKISLEVMSVRQSSCRVMWIRMDISTVQSLLPFLYT